MSETQAVAEDAIYYLPRTAIHPDPDQPRLSPDDELRASIDSEGIIQPITVRPHPDLPDEWMLVDGERRWRGGDHLETVPCRIRLDLEDPVDRLVTQLSANASKPLSPVEQALAFKKILENDEHLSQAELAKRLGIPRSTIGDRIRLTELHPVWLKLFESGELQPSHAPVLHRLVGVPAKYQLEAAATAKKSYWWGENMAIDDFVYQIEDVFKPYIHPLQKPYGGGCEFDREKYEGPTVQVHEGMRGSKTILYAADPEIWKPLVNAARAEKSKKTREMRKTGAEAIHHRGRQVKIDVPEGTPIKKVRGYGHKEPGHIQLTGWQGKWEIDTGAYYDPAVLLEHLDRSKLVVTHNDSGETEIWTTDSDAYSVARSKWEERWSRRRDQLRQEVSELVEKMPITTPHGDASRKLIEHILSGRDRNGIEDLKDMAAIAKVPVTKQIREAQWITDITIDEADGWIAKLTNTQALACLRTLIAMYYLAPEGPTSRTEEEELKERNRLSSHVAPFFPDLLAKQIAAAKVSGKPIGSDLEEEDDFGDAIGEAQLAEEDVEEGELVKA